MSAEEELRSSEQSALSNNQIISSVTGKNGKIKSSKALKSFGVMGFITLALVVFVVLFGSGTLIPSAISERLIEETDVQYADAVASKMIVFSQALSSGDIPSDTANNLKDKNILTGYINDAGEFVETNKNDAGLVLKKDDKIIDGDNFVEEANKDVQLYSALNDATYSRAGYYYDEQAKQVFKRIGTSRNNYDSDSEFDEVMNSIMGSGSEIDVNSVSYVERTKTDPDTGEEIVYHEYVENGDSAKSGKDAAGFISAVSEKNYADNERQATLNAGDALKAADTIAKEQRSSLFFLIFMENISKMKAGDGNESKINEAMNYLYQSAETEVVDVNTGEIVKKSGAPLDSPSLYAILSGEKVDLDSVKDYSSDRIIKTIENRLDAKDEASASINTTVASSSSKVKGSIGRLINSSAEKASSAILELVSPTVSKSLVDNSYDTIKGIDAGEMLVEGAVNVGAELAKASGGTVGDAEAVSNYARLNSNIIAMDAKVDRMNRSPFDITSKNTFLGSIIYNMAISMRRADKTILSGANVLMDTTSNSLISLLPSAFADANEGYLSNYGDCETYKTALGAVGSATCAKIITFDTSTLNNPYSDPGFISFVENNTTLDSSGKRTINDNSMLKNFIINNDERITPLGVMDGGILASLSANDSKIPFISNISDLIEKFMGASDNDKRMASGAMFVNSNNNPDWDTYKYAQRYVSLARATATLRQYSKDKSAYNNIPLFEGNDPVVALLEEYYASK